jgi:hypothetical protein
LTQIQCSLTQSAPSGYGFQSSDSGTTISGPPGGGSGSKGPEIKSIFGGGPNGGEGSTPMNETLYSDITNISGVAAVEPILQEVEGYNKTVYPTMMQNGVQSQSTQGFNITVPNYIIEGIPFNASLINNYPILPTNVTAGRNLQSTNTCDVFLSVNNSAYFNAGAGDTINILGTNFTVVGIYSPSGVDNQDLYMPLSEAQAITNNTDTITTLNVFGDNTSDVSSVSNAISVAHPDLNVQTAQDRLS